MSPFQARMKLPKRRRRVVAVEAPRRIRRGPGSIGGANGGGSGSAGHGGSQHGGQSGLQRRMNAIKGSHQNHVGGGGSGGGGAGSVHGGHGLKSMMAQHRNGRIIINIVVEFMCTTIATHWHPTRQAS